MKRTVLGAVCIGAAAVSTATFGTGIAAADDYSGKTYKDAQSALGDAKQTGVIAARFGDELADDDCIVTHSQKAAWLKGDDFAPVTDTVLLYLNCDAGVASATQAGNSAASPEGRAAIAAAKKEAEKKAAEAKGDGAA
ncbi:hypothetical protein [Mycolicibacterium arenosum]|uniref:PASTA domain-containing protein n=1 Tax=Mycolicibacterium arenosum TaxID=2952157 RepID=A0ABT1M3X4_9MYCO|nr:hypothetical protein [Mycolicibacterium sp. CAU 1645]MCP9273858.1 hypothetical protein [Mycolicibacterium sp. CAU 1645]